MKRNILLALLTILTLSVSAQKNVRRAIRKGNGAYKEQRYSAAEADYAKALEQNASSKQASFNLGNTFYKQQRWDEALKEHEHYLTLENEDPEKMSSAWSNMGNTYLKKKAGEKSQANGGMMPQQGGNSQEKGNQLDNLKASMEAYKNALRLNPADNETRENLAIVQKMIKDQEGDGGGDDKNQDKNQDKKDDKKQDQQNKDKNEDKKDDKKQDENQMSQDNIQQILNAIEQDERETQQRVNQAKADERKQKSERNRRQDKDW